MMLTIDRAADALYLDLSEGEIADTPKSRPA